MQRVVRWGDYLSASFCVCAGVRQGGVLSPTLFAIYIDIINKLQKLRLGCFIGRHYIGSIVYADDILLRGSSIGLTSLLGSELVPDINIHVHC